MSDHGLSGEKVGLDGCTTELIYAEAFKKAGIEAVDGQAPMYEARMIKCQEEIECVRMACSNAEAAFSDIKRAIRPGVTECELVGIGQKKLYEKGADMAWEFVCSSGNRTNPLSIDYTDRSIRPGDLVIVDINGNCFNGYMTCYYRTFCCGKPNAEQEEIFEICTTFLADTIKNMKAGVKVADVWHNIPTAQLTKTVRSCLEKRKPMSPCAGNTTTNSATRKTTRSFSTLSPLSHILELSYSRILYRTPIFY